jgi:uncharacterized protein
VRHVAPFATVSRRDCDLDGRWFCNRCGPARGRPTLNRIFIALIAGSLFGAGLAISGMADPQRVQSFLDLFGSWDPTLAFVMGGAMIPMAIAWVIQRRMERPLVDVCFDLPGTTQLDGKLALGAVLFGIG